MYSVHLICYAETQHPLTLPVESAQREL